MIEETLATFAHEARPAPAAREIVRLALFDWAVCALAGSAEPVAGAMRAHLAGQGAGAAQASAVGLSARQPARLAALANGTISHALDYDDTHFAHIGHLSVVAAPVALALAERQRLGMAQMQQAIAIGQEASVRIGLWLGRAHYQAGFHQTATAGAIGTSLAAARLLGLDRAGTLDALRIAAGSAAGLKAQFGSQAKPLNAGMAAACALEAALLAEAGLHAAPGALEGPQGFGATHAGEARIDALDGLGEAWLIERLSFKFHACCHGLHPMLEALCEAARGIGPQDVERLGILAHPRWETVCNLADPQDALQCKFSFRHTAAMLLAGHDTGRIQSFSDASAADPALKALRARVQVRFDPALAETEAHVALSLAGGGQRRARADIAAPQAASALQARLRAKAQALLGRPLADALWQASAPEAGLAHLAGLLRESTAGQG